MHSSDTDATLQKQASIKKLLQHTALWQASAIQSAINAQADNTGHSANTCHHAINSTQRVSTGFKQLDRLLSSNGWPLGQLIECLSPRYGSGVISLFSPAIQQLTQSSHSTLTNTTNTQHTPAPVIMIAPPFTPNLVGWQQTCQLQQPLWLLTPKALGDQLWAAEQILQSNTAAVVMLWLHQQNVRNTQLRRLQISAQRSNGLIIALRETKAEQEHSPAKLRLSLQPKRSTQQQTHNKTRLQVTIIKQPGNWGGQQTSIPWHQQLQHQRMSVSQWPHHTPRQNLAGNSYQKNRPAAYSRISQNEIDNKP